MNSKRFVLSKSKRNIFNSCPWKFKLKYIDCLIEPRTQYSFFADIGTNVHNEIERFYSQDVKVIDEKIKKDGKTIKKPRIFINKEKYEGKLNMSNFIKLKENILKDATDHKYFFPVSQEKEYWNEQLNIHGIVDAIYLHYKNDEYILMDWKTGKVKPDNVCREELAFYKLCIDGSGQLPKPIAYWAMFFTKHNHLFFEKVNDKTCEMVKNDIIAIRKLIKAKKFPRCTGYWCRWCGFKKTKWCNK